MKLIEELNKSKLPIAIYKKDLDKYENTPIFQDKVDKANAILTKFPPTAFLKEKQNGHIKRLLEQGMSIEQIVEQVDLLEEEVKLRISEIGF